MAAFAAGLDQAKRLPRLRNLQLVGYGDDAEALQALRLPRPELGVVHAPVPTADQHWPSSHSQQPTAAHSEESKPCPSHAASPFSRRVGRGTAKPSSGVACSSNAANAVAGVATMLPAAFRKPNSAQFSDYFELS